jgi:hypothetical protein
MLPSFPLPSTCIDARAPFLRVSGIYPHLAAWNHRWLHDDGDGGRWFARPECGIGAVVDWAGRLWFLTYTSHDLYKGPDKLFSVLPDKTIEIHPASAGGTHACRMIHRPSRQLFIGCYAIDAAGNVRVIDRQKLPGRLTAIAKHLTDPENKIYYYTQECSLYEVNVHTLEPTLLFIKPLPGWHAKGAYTAQGRLVVAHNGEQPGPSPFWQVDYANLDLVTHEVEKHLQTRTSYGPEDWGVLGEWDGREWRVISRRQHNDVMGPGGDGIASSEQSDEPIWAQGWDQRSLLLHVCHANRWTLYRLPKGSYTYEAHHGSFTEWPRFRAIGGGRWLAALHGTFFEWSAAFRPGHTGGVRPLCTYQRYIPDFGPCGDELVLAGQDTSRHGVPWAVPGHSHSNLQFLNPAELENWGPRSGFGGVWQQTPVRAGHTSDPFLVAGYDRACLHLAFRPNQALANNRSLPVTFTLEFDAKGDDTWTEAARITLPPSGYACHQFEPAQLGARWVRLRADRDGDYTAYFHLASPRQAKPNEHQIFAGLADLTARQAYSGGLLHVSAHNHNLCWLAREVSPDGVAGPETYIEIDEHLSLHRAPDSPYAAEVRERAGSEAHVSEDPASLVVIGANGQRYRLPRSPHQRQRALPFTPRDIREVIQERALANLGGTFYEVPRYADAEARELRWLPHFAKMRPIASHRAEIIDFTVWRGLLVLSGVRADATNDGHTFGDGGLGLWFGAFDDLWKLGAPVGEGGPWLKTPVAAGVPSDPYLMTGFDHKVLRLSHQSESSIIFHLEVDVTGDGVFLPYASLEVPAKEELRYEFPAGYHAHWLRITPIRATVATAQLMYR